MFEAYFEIEYEYAKNCTSNISSTCCSDKRCAVEPVPNGQYKIALGAGPIAYKLRILHTNDHHARMVPVTLTLRNTPDPDITREFGGVARRKTLIDQVRASAAADDNVLLLDAGDVFQGTLYFTQFSGQADLFCYNAMGYDAVTLGNHEFDKGQAPLKEFILGANFPVLSANLVVQPPAVLVDALAPTDVAVAGRLGKRLIVAKGGKNIGIFGLTPPKTGILSNVGIGVLFGATLTSIAQAQVDALKAEGANYIIGLTHIGYSADLQLAAQVRGLNVIIGGHSHTPLLPTTNPPHPVGTEPEDAYPTLVKDPDGKDVVVTTAWKWGKWLGDITLGFDAASALVEIGGVIWPVWAGGLGTPPRALLSGEGAEITPDAALQTQIDTVYKPPLAQLQATVVGRATVLLDGERANVCNRETNLGNLITDIMLNKMRLDGGQIALINAGSIRKSIPAGDITLARVLEVLPYDHTIVHVDLTGAQILQALENAVSQVNLQNPGSSAGRFAQVSGLRFTWAANRPVGKRILKAEVQSTSLRSADTNASAGAEPAFTLFTRIDPTATYSVITNNFMLSGGDEYLVFAQGTNAYDTGFILADLLSEHINANTPVSAFVEGRITIANSIYLPWIFQQFASHA